MPTASRHPGSISAALDAPMPGAAVFRCKPSAPPWEPTPTATAAESPLLTIAAAAEVVPLSVKQLYRVAEREDSPFRKVEGRWMVYAADLHRWIRSHAGGSKPETPAAGDGGSLADRVRRRREGSAA